MNANKTGATITYHHIPPLPPSRTTKDNIATEQQNNKTEEDHKAINFRE